MKLFFFNRRATAKHWIQKGIGLWQFGLDKKNEVT